MVEKNKSTHTHKKERKQTELEDSEHAHQKRLMEADVSLAPHLLEVPLSGTVVFPPLILEQGGLDAPAADEARTGAGAVWTLAGI